MLISYLQLPPSERRSVLAKVPEWLAPNGLLLMVSHHFDNLTHGYGGPKSTEVLPTHGELADEVAGLDVEKSERVEREVETAEGPRVAIDALLRARKQR